MTTSEEIPRILIVDDTPHNLQVLGSILEKENYRINVATNGLQALESVLRIQPDLILLDIMMPEMDGFETCRQLKANAATRDIPVIFLTARVESEDVVRGFELGAMDYITKPFQHAELLRRVRTHIDLRRKTRALEESNRSFRELLHVLSHDLANPLGFIYSILDMAEDDPEVLPKMQSSLMVAVNNCLSMIEMVRQMRALEEGKIKLSLHWLLLQPLVEAARHMVGTRLSGKNITLNVAIDSSLRILAEEVSFVNTVIANLLSNAIKFSQPGSVINISAREEGEQVVLSVQDFGIGMPEEIRLRLFDLNAATSRKGTAGESGTGFGLPLVQKFVQAYGGSMEVVSSEKEGAGEHGTTVFLYLPGKSA